MTPETFFEHFELFAEAPNGVEKLRELILQLAIKGKLVPQDRSEEPATRLYERMQRERKRLSKASDTTLVLLDFDDDLSHGLFPLPPSWRWTRLSEFGCFLGGGTPSKQRLDFWDGEIPWVSPKDMKRPYIDDAIDHVSVLGVENSSGRLIPGNSLLMVIRGMILIHSFPVALSMCELTINQDMKALLLAIPETGEYLLRCCQASKSRVLDKVERSSHGTCRLATADVANTLIPLAPLAEQRRIVAKVDELMGLCDELEVRQKAKREGRERLVASALDKLLSARDASEFAAHLQRLRDHFDLLFDTPATIPHLRQAILQLAVQGSLVSQDEREEAVSFIVRLAEERRKLVSDRVIARDKSLPPVAEHETPFVLPSNWKWVRIGEVASAIDYGTSQKASPIPDGVPVLRMNNIQEGCVLLKNLKYVPSTIDDLPRLMLKHNDILFNRTNSFELVGKTGVFKGINDSFTFASYLIRATLLDGVSADYINFCMNARYFRKTQIEPEVTQQCGQANYNGTKMRHALIPLAPQAEQVRIVERVNQLLSLCDRLEAQLAKSEAATGTLLSATVHHLLQS